MSKNSHCLIGCLVVCALLALSATASADNAPVGASAILQLQDDASGHSLSLRGHPPFRVTTSEIVDQRAIGVPESRALLILWDEIASGSQARPHYAISLDGQHIARQCETSYVLKLRHGDFDPVRGVPAPAAGLAANEGFNLYVVQFVTQPLEVFRSQIEELGGTVYHFLANHAHIVKMSPGVRDAVAELPYVRWVGPYHPAYRLEELMRDHRAQADELFPLQRYNIQVLEAGPGQKQLVADQIESLGGTMNARDAGKFLLEATLTPEQLYEVVSWNEILFIDRWSPYENDMNNARELGGANHIETVAGYTGAGVRGEVFDAGFNLAHVDFSSHPLIQHGVVGSDSHGAATSGIVFGDGTGNPNARGLLPDAQGIVADYNTIGLTGTTRYNHTGELIQPPYFAVFQTSSVGSSRTTQYTTISADTDASLFDFDIVHCQSQSNAGDQMSRPQAWAKNIISGGGVRHYDTLTMADDCWCSGASIGPATDGRIKPDLCAFYDDILTTTTGSPTAYTTSFGGTSGATPIIAGHVGLVFQMWADGIFGNDVDPVGSVFDNRCHMTTAKALLINSAQQYPFSGTSHDLTRVHQGWGWPDVGYLYDMRERMVVIDESILLGNMESEQFLMNVEAGEPEFHATLVYADPPGVPSSSQHRINDLTLKVTSPTGDIYWGNYGLLASNYSVVGGYPDTADTVENVIIQNPTGGLWIVEVFADEVNQDSHVETAELDADFALVVGGVLPCSPTGRVRLDRELYACNSAVTIEVIDCDLNVDEQTPEGVSITIASVSEPAGETVTLTETGPSTAQFLGTMQLSDVDEAGVLLVADGGTITATYIDEDDGQGGVNVPVDAIAGLDCLPPVITNVQVLGISTEAAIVTFNTDELAVGTVRYGLSCDALNESATTIETGTSHVIRLENLNYSTRYFFAIDAEDNQGNVGTNDNGGACHTFSTLNVVFDIPMNQDPGWLTQGLWAFGQPSGGGSFGGDPTSGRTGDNVYGYNLNGDYTNQLPPQYLMTPALDCTGLTHVTLTFWRWLGVESRAGYDDATVEVSNNGVNWILLWRATDTGDSISDTSWHQQQFDLSAIADNQPTVSVRWGMGPTDRFVTYPGWNVDDVQIIAAPDILIPGDLDCDGDMDFDDINPFVLALSGEAAYLAQYPNCNWLNADCNNDGDVNFDDINGFVALLGG